MHWLNWVVLVGWITYIAWDGIRRARGTTEIQGYFLAGRSLPWWVVGLTVMATQLSAITMIGTTGQGATDGMRFIQFYFGLPVAMVILGVTLVPFLRGANVFTAYEYLERRFDAKTRSLTAFLFLLSRGLSCGTIIAAPAVVFSAIFGWNMLASVALIGIPTVLYTMVGGVKAVAWTDVKQIVLIVSALIAVVIITLIKLPVSPDEALRLAGAGGRLKVFDFRFDVNQTYTFWSGLIGGTFLMLSYFGTDQSQVQRYLAARSVDEARSSLLISAYWKIPLQALVLLVGVLVFVYQLFQAPPLLFNPSHEHAVRQAEPAALASLEARYKVATDARAVAARAGDLTALKARQTETGEVRTEALALAAQVTGQPSKDVNYLMPRFVLDVLPIGFAGLFIAAVMAAAMSAVAGELSALSTTTVIDFYRRWIRSEAPDAHYLRISKVATGMWGLFACLVATFAANLGSLIEVVNRFGSFFYGSILGVFLLAMIPGAKARGAFVGLITGMATVGAVSFGYPDVSFLWHNVIGAVTVVTVGMLLSVGGGDA